MSEAVDVGQELREATERARHLVQTTEPRLFTVRPNNASWSASECIAHLSISTEMFLPVLREAIDDARARGLTADEPPSMDLLGRILRWFMEPPVRKRMRTAAPFVPKGVRAKAESLNEFLSLQARLMELLEAARTIAMSRIRIVSPFDTRVRYNLYSAFRIIAAHQRRHLWQAEQAVAQLRMGSGLQSAVSYYE